MRALMLALALSLAGCATYDSAYWRHPVTGVTVESEASWRNALGLDGPTGSLDVRDYCGRLMQRAGPLRISHDEGKQWEKTSSR